MKVGDLVKFKGATCEHVGNPGFGTIVKFIRDFTTNKNTSAEVYWSKLEITQWHLESALEVVSECK